MHNIIGKETIISPWMGKRLQKGHSGERDIHQKERRAFPGLRKLRNEAHNPIIKQLKTFLICESVSVIPNGGFGKSSLEKGDVQCGKRGGGGGDGVGNRCQRMTPARKQ